MGNGMAEDGKQSSFLHRTESLRSSPSRSPRVSVESQNKENNGENMTPSTPFNSSIVQTSKSTSSESTSQQSFLQDRTPVRGVQDIIGRMRASDQQIQTGGQNEEDQKALSLLNKFIGAQILVQCAEPMVIGAANADDISKLTKQDRDACASTLQTSHAEHVSPDGKTVTRSSTALQQQTDTNDQGGTTWTTNRTSSSSTVSQSQDSSFGQPTAHDHITMNAATLVIDGVDINAGTDNGSVAKNGPNAISNQSGRTFSSSVSTKSEVITRRTSVQTTRNQSAFSKFQQLDQSVKSTPR